MAKRVSKKELKEKELVIEISRAVPLLSFEGFTLELIQTSLHTENDSLHPEAEHIHEFYELHVTLAGSGKVIIENRKSFKYTKGQFILNLPYQVHYWQGDEKSAPKMLLFWFKVKDCEDTSDFAQIMQKIDSQKNCVFETPELVESFYKQILLYLDKRPLGFIYLVESLLKYMIVALLKQAMGAGISMKSSVFVPKKLSSSMEVIETIDQFLHENMAQKITLSTLSRVMNMSERNLTRFYREQTKKTIFQKLHELRMYRAEELMRETNKQVKEIAYECGIHSVSRFCKEFRGKFSCSPLEFRNKIHGGHLKKRT